jgi:molybdopterin-guanine dinucleotide biosynthesis protein A
MLSGSLCSGYVLTGGKSSRMGMDKALLPVNGQALALWVADNVKEAARSVSFVGDRAKYGHLGLPVVEDVRPGQGPLSGIHAALSQTRTPLNLIVGCDLPFLSGEFLDRLATIAAVTDADVTVAESLEHGYQAVCAVYNRTALPIIEECLTSGTLKLSRVYERLAVRKLSPEEWTPFNRQGLLFHNVNTPEDYEQACRRLEAMARGVRA